MVNPIMVESALFNELVIKSKFGKTYRIHDRTGLKIWVVPELLEKLEKAKENAFGDLLEVYICTEENTFKITGKKGGLTFKGPMKYTYNTKTKLLEVWQLKGK